MENPGQAPLTGHFNCYYSVSYCKLLWKKASAKWIKCNVIMTYEVPAAARFEFRWKYGAPKRPQTSRVADGEVLWQPPQAQRGKKGKCQSSAVYPCPHSLELSAQSDTISQNTCVGGVWVRAAFNYHVKLIYHVVKQTSTVTPMSILLS